MNEAPRPDQPYTAAEELSFTSSGNQLDVPSAFPADSQARGIADLFMRYLASSRRGLPSLSELVSPEALAAARQKQQADASPASEAKPDQTISFGQKGTPASHSHPIGSPARGPLGRSVQQFLADLNTEQRRRH